ncbi:MAG: hypothetical protein ACLU48_05750 [Clostridiaceae bacterium]
MIDPMNSGSVTVTLNKLIGVHWCRTTVKSDYWHSPLRRESQSVKADGSAFERHQCSSEQIAEMNFESFVFRGDECQHDDLPPCKRAVLFPESGCISSADEHSKGSESMGEDAVNAFRVDFDCDIYVTGSNACLLSSGVFHLPPGGVSEAQGAAAHSVDFLIFTASRLHEEPECAQGTPPNGYSTKQERYELREAFDACIRFGGMLGSRRCRSGSGKSTVSS